MKKTNGSQSHKELAHLYEAMMKHDELYPLAVYISKYPDWLISDVKDFLSGGKLTSLINGDSGSYDATINEDGTQLFVEVTMDENNNIEDCYCTCNTGFCTHLAAVLWKIHEELSKEINHQPYLN